MRAKHLSLISLIISTNAIIKGTVSEQNVTKRETNIEDLFPDWVPFKNKHGEELGEFVQVNKPKPKKRLAPPVNFILRAVAEPEGDDYYDKGQGESDSDDYYEKKEWSDTNRLPDPPKIDNHTELSDIDGVVSIIQAKSPLNPIVEALRRAKQKQKVEEGQEETKPSSLTSRSNPAENRKRNDPAHKYEDDMDYEESNTEKRKPEAMEEEKTSVLDSVDELKERHAKEATAISEKLKEEEIYKEERERDRIQVQLSLDETLDKYAPKKAAKKSFADYEEYDDKDSANDERYRINSERASSTSTTSQLPKRTTKNKSLKDKKIETGKLSVFKNPQLYMIYDEDSEETTTVRSRVKPPKSKPGRVEKYSSKYTKSATASLPDDNDRISLVPEENEGKEGEPTLFFPIKRKTKNKKRKSNTPTTTTNSIVADSAETSKNETQALETKNKATKTKYQPVTDTTGSASIKLDMTDETALGTTYIVSTTTETVKVTDAVAASSVTKEKEKKDEDYQRERGGGKEYHSQHEEEHTEEGKKAYEGLHKETKSAKGYHDKENHLGKYDDRGGINKQHEEESGHYGAHHHEEHGKKHAKYEESGKHSKGHSTKGSHDIHKKEEYEKKVEFFEEEGDSDEVETHGGYNEEHGHEKGGHFKKENYKAGHEQHAKGDSGHFTKGAHLHVSKGHKLAAGHDDHGKHGRNYHQKKGKEAGKKWIYHHGSPAKTANLMPIDRRLEAFYHGAPYYG